MAGINKITKKKQKEINKGLLKAIKEGNREEAASLLDLGADPDFVMNRWSGPACIDAVKYGHIDIIPLLAEHGVSFNTIDNCGHTALGVAVLHGNIKAIKTLLECGADPNMRDYYGCTALLGAVSYSFHFKKSIIKILLKAGADPNIQDSGGKSVLNEALSNEDIDIKMLRFLLECGADPNLRDDKGRTALMSCFYSNKTDKMKLLLEYGADVNIVDKDGYSSLIHLLMFWDNPEIMEILLQAGADPNIADNTGKTLLMWICRNPRGRQETINRIIAAGADINAADSKAITPLMYLAEAGHVSLIRHFIGLGADTTARNDIGETVLDILRTKWPDKYENSILKVQRKNLEKEDSAKTPVTGYEFDI